MKPPQCAAGVPLSICRWASIMSRKLSSFQIGKVIEVPASAGAGAIQAALDEAATMRGRRPIVHLPMGIYNVTKTLVVSPESDVQLVGDSAGETGTRLNWTGPAGGLLLKLEGPAIATLRDLHLHAPDA